MSSRPIRAAVLAAVVAVSSACSPATDEAGHRALASAARVTVPRSTTSGSISPTPAASDPFRWSARVPGDVDGLVVRRHVVLVSSWGRPLRAFSASCGRRQAECEPLWQTAHAAAVVAVSGDRVLIAEMRTHRRRVAIASLPLRCRAVDGICRTSWSIEVRQRIEPKTPGAERWGAIPDSLSAGTLARAVVYTAGFVDLGWHHPGEFWGPLYAFPSRCPRSSACSILWKTPPLAGIGTPTVAHGIVFVPSTSGIYAFREGCRSDGGLCRPLWHAPTNIRGNGSNAINRPVVAAGRVFVTTRGDAGGGDAVPPAIFAFPVACRRDGGVCPAAWSWTVRPWARSVPAPSILGDGVLVATPGGPVRFPVGCVPVSGQCPTRSRLASAGSSGSTFSRSFVLGGNLAVVPVERPGTSRPIGFDVFTADCRSATCHAVARWRSSERLRWIVGPVDDEILVRTRRGLVLVSVATSRSSRPHVTWRWSGPTRGSIDDPVAIQKCTIYAAVRATLYAIPSCSRA